jgi:hypothetical protein
MKRFELLDTVQGRHAYLTFNEWRKICKRPVLSVEEFVNSRNYKAFQKFSDFIRERNLPNKRDYMSYMVSKNMPPQLWSDYDVYDNYIQNFDNNYSIDYKINTSLETISELCRTYECLPAEIFEHVKPIQLLKIINARKLSPWILLQSNKFMDYLKYKTNKEERVLFNTFIDISRWKKDLSENPSKVSEIKSINKELGI